MKETESLTTQESFQLVKLEKIIKNGEKTFVEVGDALAQIRDNKLYRVDHNTFEDYCNEVWGWSKQHSYRLISAAPVAKSNPQVTNLAAAKSLSKVPPPKRAGVVAQIVQAGKKVTAAAISKVAGKPPVKPTKRVLDGTGLEVPPEILGLWERMADAQELLTAISSVRGTLRKAQEEKDILFIEVDFTDDLAKLNQVFLDLQRAKPFAVCPTCSGVETKGCLTCKGRGFVSEFYWKYNVAQETKDITNRK